MSFADLPDFLDRLEKDCELVRVKAPVDPHLEITEIVDRVVRAGGPALLFENVKGSAMPLAMNVFGTTARMAKALGVADLDEIGARIADLLKPELPHGFSGFKDAIGKLGQLRAVPPKNVRKGSCQDVVVKGDDVDLMALPALHTWPADGGAYFNLGLTHTKHPETGQPYSPDFAAMARAAGVAGVTIDRTADLGEAVRAGLASGKPYLIDANIDGDQNPGGAGVWELPGIGRNQPAFGGRFAPR